jgi:predicted nucleic acid-binding Zn finger protein
VKIDKQKGRDMTLVRTALHIVVMALRTEFVEIGQCGEAYSLELGQGNFTIFVLIDGVENSIDDYLSLPLMLFVVLREVHRLAYHIRGRTIAITFDFFCEYT